MQKPINNHIIEVAIYLIQKIPRQRAIRYQSFLCGIPSICGEVRAAFAETHCVQGKCAHSPHFLQGILMGLEKQHT